MQFRVSKQLTVLSWAIAVSLAVTATSAVAGTATSNLAVNASIAANCTISTNPVDFGAYDPVSTNASTPLTASGSVDTVCTQGASATVTLDQGANPDSGSTASVPVRRMVGGGGTDYLNYNLYSDSGNTTTFDGTTGVPVTGTGSSVSTTVYGSIPAAQNSLPAGSYSDTVVATVSF